jgi:hypothetical protein
VWCKDCRRQVEPDPAEMATRYGAPLSHVRAPAREGDAGNQTPWPADKVERWAIDRLIPYAKNARTHTDAQVAAIASSIKEWGWTTPALVAEDGGLIAGHARVLAARQAVYGDRGGAAPASRLTMRFGAIGR